METRRQLLERKIKEARDKLATLDGWLNPMRDKVLTMQNQRARLVARIGRLEKKLERL